MNGDNDLKDGLKRGLEHVPAPMPPGLDRVARRARNLRARRYVAGAAVAAVIVAGMAVPLATLAGIGGNGSDVVTPGGTEGTVAQRGVLPDVLEVVCDGERTTALTPQVRPQPDGVHIRVDNGSGQELIFSMRYPDGSGGGKDVEPGVTDPLTPDGSVPGWPAPPGVLTVSCQTEEQFPNGPTAHVEVVDADSIWVSPALDCQGGQSVTGTAVFPDGAQGEAGEPVNLARAHFKGLLETDVVERAGYPDADPGLVRVGRDSRTIATAHFVLDEEGDGWLLAEVSRCSDSGIEG